MLTKKIDRSGLRLNFMFVILAVALLGALLLSSNNKNLLWLLLFPPVIFFIWKSNFWTLVLISLIVFFGDWLIGLGLVNQYFMWAHEALIALLFLKALTIKLLKREHIVFTGGWIVVAFSLVSMISLYINKTGTLNLLLFMRLILTSYFVFLAVVNLDWKEKELKNFINLLLFMIIIQLPVAFIKMLTYGQGEQAIGTYDYHGGTLSTALPLIVIGFGIAFYLVYKRSLLFIGLVLGAIAFAIIGGKRGFIFFLPLVLIFISWYLRRDIHNLFKYAVLGGIVFFVALYFALSFVPTLSPERGLKSSIDPKYAISFATEYTTSQSRGLSWGRTQTNINVFQNLASRGFLHFLFGAGPGSAMKSRFDALDTRNKLTEEFNVGYGITGMTWTAMNAGYLGVFLVFTLLYVIMRKSSSYFKTEEDLFWSAYGLGVAVFSFVMIVINFAYAPIILDDLLATHFFCLSGFIILKMKKQT